MDINTINTAKRVKDARIDAKLTQTELGMRIGRSKQWVSELERGISNSVLRWQSVSLMHVIKRRNFFVIKVHEKLTLLYYRAWR